jgi:hypothetical protein
MGGNGVHVSHVPPQGSSVDRRTIVRLQGRRDRLTPDPDSEHQAALVWQLSGRLSCHSVLGWPGRAHLGSDLMMLQRLAERAPPPGGRAGGAEKWD